MSSNKHNKNTKPNQMKNMIFTLVVAMSFLSITTFAKNNKSKFAVNNHSTKISNKTQMLVDFMESQFSGVSQNDGNNLALSSAPIWKNKKDGAGKWIYVEQASSENVAHPFRQKVYNVAQINDSTFVTAVYNLPNSENHVGEWKSENALASISPADLDFKKGCDVFLVFYKNNQMQLGNNPTTANSLITQSGATFTCSPANSTKTNIPSTTSKTIQTTAPDTVVTGEQPLD